MSAHFIVAISGYLADSNAIVYGKFNTVAKVDSCPQEQITQSLLCKSTTDSNDLERSDTKLEAPSFPIE